MHKLFNSKYMGTEWFSTILPVKITWETNRDYHDAWTPFWNWEMRQSTCASLAGAVKCHPGTLGMVAEEESLRMSRESKAEAYYRDMILSASPDTQWGMDFIL